MYIILALIAAVVTLFAGAPWQLSAAAPPHFVTSQVNPDKTGGKVLGMSNGMLTFSAQGRGQSNGGVVVLSAKEDPKIQVNSYELSGLGEFSLYKVSRQDLTNYLLYRRVNTDPGSISKVYTIDEGTLQQKQEFSAQVVASKNTQNHLNEFSLPIDGTGVWFLKGTISGNTFETMVVRSDLAAIVHRGDNENVFWVQDTAYSSVSGAKIELFNAQNTLTPLDILSTGSDGLSTNAINEAVDFALVSKGEDLTILPINLENLMYRSGFGKNSYSSFSKRQESTATFTFTDRFVYKPGDTVSFKAIIRSDDDANYAINPGQAITVSFGNERTLFSEKTYIVSVTGTVDGTLTIPKDARSGYYPLVVKAGEQYLSDTMLQVAAFRKPDASIHVETDKLAYLPQETLTAVITAETFLGQPIHDQEIRYKVYQENALVQGDFEHINYLRSQSYFRPDKNPISSGSVKLDRKGIGTLKLPVTNTTGFRQFWIIHVEYVDPSGNTSNDAIQTLIYPADFSIEADGNQPQGVLGRELSLPLKLVRNKKDALIQNIPLSGKLILTNQNGKEELIQDGLRSKSEGSGKFVLNFTPTVKGNYRLEVESKDRNGNPSRSQQYLYIYSSSEEVSPSADLFTFTSDKATYEVGETATITIKTKPDIRNVFVSLGRSYSREFRALTLANGVATFELPVQEKYQPNFFVTIGSFSKDQWVQQTNKLMVNTEDKHVSVKITSDKPSYGAGETATFTLTATDGKGKPVQTDLAFWIFDKALLELHDMYSTGIFDRFWHERYYDIPTHYSYQGILNVNSGGGGGGCFTGDTLVTLADGTRKQIEKIVVGDQIKTFSSLATKSETAARVGGVHTVTVDGYLILNGALRITPEHKLLVNGQWKTAGEMQIGDTVLSEKGTPVRVSSLEWVRERTKVYNLKVDIYHTFIAGGIYVHNDKGEGARSSLKDTAYWNPHVVTGADGTARLTVKLPDNLTTWVTAAISANARTQVGEGRSELKVTKDVVAIPILPQFFRVGDKVILGGILQNYTDTKETFVMNASFTGATLDKSSQTATIESKEFAEFFWPLRVPALKEDAVFQLRAVGNGNNNRKDAISAKIPIYPYGTWMTSYTKREGSTDLLLQPSPGTDPLRASARVELSAYRYPELQNVLSRQINSGSYNVESAASVLTAASIFKKYEGTLGLHADAARLNEVVLTAQNRLKSERKSMVWEDPRKYGKLSMSMTRYALESLTLAKSAGFTIDEELFLPALSFVKGYAAQSTLDKIEQQYIFSLFPDGDFKREKIDVNQLSKPQEIAIAAIANQRQGFVKSTQEVMKLMSVAQETATQYSWYDCPENWYSSWYCISLPSAWSIRALTELQFDTGKLEKSLDHLYRNDESDARQQAVQALATIGYYERTGQRNQNYTYIVKFGEKILAEGKVTPSTTSIPSLILTAEQLRSGQSLSIQKNGNGKLYSQLSQKEFFTDPKSSAKTHDLTLTRKYLSNKTSTEPLVAGDLVIVEFAVSGLGRGETEIEIEDYLPAGLIAIDQSFDNGNFDQNPRGGAIQEVTTQGMRLTFSVIGKNEGTFSYKARVVTGGEFLVPPATVRLVRSPAIWAHTSGDVFKVDGKVTLENLAVSDSQTREDLYGKETKKSFIQRILETQKVAPIAAVVGAISILIVVVLILRARATGV